MFTCCSLLEIEYLVFVVVVYCVNCVYSPYSIRLSSSSHMFIAFDPIEYCILRSWHPLNIGRNTFQCHIQRSHAGTVAEAMHQRFKLHKEYNILINFRFVRMVSNGIYLIVIELGGSVLCDCRNDFGKIHASSAHLRLQIIPFGLQESAGHRAARWGACNGLQHLHHFIWR